MARRKCRGERKELKKTISQVRGNCEKLQELKRRTRGGAKEVRSRNEKL